MVIHDHTRPAAPPPSWADPSLGPARVRDAAPLVAWAGFLAVAIVLLAALGGGRLAAPALTAPSTWGSWAAGRDPFEVAMAVVRLLGLGLAWYLVGVTSVSVLARLCRAVRLVRLADALSFGPVRTVVQQALGVGLATGVVLAAVPATSTNARADTVVTMAPLAEDTASLSASQPLVRPVSAVPADAAVALAARPPIPAPEARAPVAPSPTPPAPSPSPAAPSPAPTAVAESAAPVVVPSDPPAAREVTVRSGDHFWSLAEDAVAAHLGRPGTEAEVARHWRAVVAANADRLAVPGNADLLLPGQVVVVPSPASGGRS